MRALAAALVVLAWLAAPAGASEVWVERSPGKPCRECSGPVADNETLRVTGGPGERNALGIARRSGEIVVTDRTAALRAGEGCIRESEHRARCAVEDLSGAYVVAGDADDSVRLDIGALVELGAGNDRLEVEGPAVDAAGGPGDDVLLGGPGRDHLNAGTGGDRLEGGDNDDTLLNDEGPGLADAIGFPDEELAFAAGTGAGAHDEFHGGDGLDYVSYGGRRPPIHIDLRAGRAGRDRLRSIERIQGGHGDDTVMGDDGPNFISGGGGRDRLIGRGGADELTAGGEMSGGAGRDSFWGIERGAAIRCGAGRDDVDSLRRGVTLDSCEAFPMLYDGIQIRVRERRLRVSGFCRLSTPCRFRVVLASRDGTVLARRSIEPRRDDPFVAVPLTGRGVRLLRRHARVRAVLTATEETHRGAAKPQRRTQRLNVVL